MSSPNLSFWGIPDYENQKFSSTMVVQILHSGAFQTTKIKNFLQLWSIQIHHKQKQSSTELFEWYTLLCFLGLSLNWITFFGQQYHFFRAIVWNFAQPLIYFRPVRLWYTVTPVLPNRWGFFFQLTYSFISSFWTLEFSRFIDTSFISKCKKTLLLIG